jgi:putative flippase GtrA
LVSFIRYLLTAGAATVVDVALVQTLLSFDLLQQPIFFILAIAIGALAGMSVNFALSSRFVFTSDQRSGRQQYGSFILVSLTTLLFRLVVATGLAGLLALPVMAWTGMLPVDAPAERLAHLGAVGLVTIYSFFAHKHVSFAGGFLALFANKSAVRP